ncbi:MAG: universal stress protein [Dehalococcoidia bacterium]
MSEPLIVVALDGSELSERVLPFATTFAKATAARMLLLTVWEEGERALITSLPGESEGIFKLGEEHWEQYLAGLAKATQASGVDVEAAVVIGDAGEEILREVERRDPRLLVVATHGRSGLSRWRYGSVAARLAREAPVPTLIVGPAPLEDKARDGAVRRILVPLDGSPLAETALRPAVELAETFGADLLLAQALQWATQAFVYGVPEVDVSRIDLELTKASEEYLAKTRDSLQTERPVRTSVLHGPPADALIAAVEAENIDLVVMTSHARGGLARAVLGSVADRLPHGKAPVLMIRPEEIASFTHKASPGRYCHACGRASAFVEVLPEERCRRCGQHLHVCQNCVYFDGVACLLQRPELHDAVPGRDCPYFQFRESASPEEAKRRASDQRA